MSPSGEDVSALSSAAQAPTAPSPSSTFAIAPPSHALRPQPQQPHTAGLPVHFPVPIALAEHPHAHTSAAARNPVVDSLLLSVRSSLSLMAMARGGQPSHSHSAASAAGLPPGIGIAPGGPYPPHLGPGPLPVPVPGAVMPVPSRPYVHGRSRPLVPPPGLGRSFLSLPGAPCFRPPTSFPPVSGVGPLLWRAPLVIAEKPAAPAPVTSTSSSSSRVVELPGRRLPADAPAWLMVESAAQADRAASSQPTPSGPPPPLRVGDASASDAHTPAPVAAIPPPMPLPVHLSSMPLPPGMTLPVSAPPAPLPMPMSSSSSQPQSQAPLQPPAPLSARDRDPVGDVALEDSYYASSFRDFVTSSKENTRVRELEMAVEASRKQTQELQQRLLDVRKQIQLDVTM